MNNDSHLKNNTLVYTGDTFQGREHQSFEQENRMMNPLNTTQSQNIYAQIPVSAADWKARLLNNRTNKAPNERETKSQENTLIHRKSNRKLAMSHYNPGIYRPPSKNDSLAERTVKETLSGFLENEEDVSANRKSSYFKVDDASRAVRNSDSNNNNHKHGKLFKKSSKISNVSYKKFYEKYNLKINGCSSDSPFQKNIDDYDQVNNNSIPPGGSILTMAKHMIQKYQPPVTPEKTNTDFLSYFKNNGSNIFVSISNPDLFDESHSVSNCDENQCDELSQLDADESRTRVGGRASSSKKFHAHVEKVTVLSENQLAANSSKKSRIYLNTSSAIKRACNPGSASLFLKEKYHDRSIKSNEIAQGYDQTVHNVMKNLYDSWLEQSQCDVSIMTDEGEILSHQALLSSFSSSLAHQFKKVKPLHENDANSDKPPQITVIDMSKFSRDTITDVLHYLYTNDIRLTDTNVTRFLMVAKKLDLHTVTKKCEEYLLREGPDDDLLLHYFIANNCDLGNVKLELQSKVAMHFDQMCTKSNITKLSRSLLVAILDHRDLVSKEENKLLAVSKWIEHNKGERMKYVAELMTFVKFENIPIDTLTSLVENLEWMFTSSCMRNKLLEAYRFHTAKDTKEKEETKEAVNLEEDEPAKQASEICDNNNAYKSFHKTKSIDKLQSTKATEDSSSKTLNRKEFGKCHSSSKLIETVQKESNINYKCFNEKKKLKKSNATDTLNLEKLENSMESCSSAGKKQSPTTATKSPMKKSPRTHQFESNYETSHGHHTDFNYSNCQSNQRANHHHQADAQRSSRKPLQSKNSHKKAQNNVGTCMTPGNGTPKGKESTVSTNEWKGAAQGVISIFESKFNPPPVKQYQLQNNLASVKFTEIKPNL